MSAEHEDAQTSFEIKLTDISSSHSSQIWQLKSDYKQLSVEMQSTLKELIQMKDSWDEALTTIDEKHSQVATLSQAKSKLEEELAWVRIENDEWGKQVTAQA